MALEMNCEITSFVFVTVPLHTRTLAEKIRNQCRINGLDALYLACAIKQGIETFLTCDYVLLRSRKCIRQFHIEIVNPIEYVRRIK